MTIVGDAEPVEEFHAFGIRAFTTARTSGSFGLGTEEPVVQVMGRWSRLREELRPGAPRLATASQVHGERVIVHGDGWDGWLRADAADGHVAIGRGTALAVTVADCVPIFLAHPSGAVAALHSGWRGTAARILERGLAAFIHRGLPASEIRLHLGPAICGKCYEVGPEVLARLTGRTATASTPVDLRAIIADQGRAVGLRHITVSARCTRCDNARFFSHRGGDAGRQLGVIVADR